MVHLFDMIYIYESFNCILSLNSKTNEINCAISPFPLSNCGEC